MCLGVKHTFTNGGECKRLNLMTPNSTPTLLTSSSAPKSRNIPKNTTPKMLQVKGCSAPILLFFQCFTLGSTFGFLKEFGGTSTIDLVIEIFGSLFEKFGYCQKFQK